MSLETAMQMSTNEGLYMEDSVVILIDADSLYYRCCMVTQKQHEIRKNINSMMSNIERECSLFCDNVLVKVAVKGKGNFRYDIFSDYKGNRTTELEPHIKEALNYAHNYLIEKFDAVRCDGMEADDMVAIWSWECIKAGIDYYIVHIDKDLDMIPGRHYNFTKDEHYVVDFDKANYNFIKQCLTGDSADHIPGIKGIGPKKSEKLLDGIPYNQRWSIVKSQWADAKQMLISARLLWMSTTQEEVDSANELMLKRLDAKTLDEFWLGVNDEDGSESTSEASECEQDVREEGSSDVQTEGVSGLPT